MKRPSHKLLDRIVRLLYRQPVAALLVWAGLAVWGAKAASHLGLTANFSELLPQNLPSVVELDRVKERLGGMGNFIIVIENRNFEAAKQYAEALVREIQEKMPPGMIRYIDYRNGEQRDFLEKNKYLYVDKTDLEAIHSRLKAKIEFDTTCKNPFYLDFTGQCKKDPGFDITDIQDKYGGEGSRYDQYRDGYYTNKDASLLAIVLKPIGDPTSVNHTRTFIDTIVPIINSVDPAGFDPSLKYHLTGNYIQGHEEHVTLRHDIASTGALCLALVALILFLYYRNLRTIFFITASICIGLCWTYGLAYLHVKVLTSLTAFMGSIVLGNGINNAIIFLARYLEERRNAVSASAPVSVEDSVATAAITTIGATFTASFTTAGAFLVLLLSDLRAYREFGSIGAIGMVLCWLAAYLVIPPLISLGEKIRPLAITEMRTAHATTISWVGRLIHESPGRVAVGGLILSLVAAVGSYFFWQDPYEHNYLNVRSERSIKSGSAFWNQRLMDEVFDISLTPVAIVMDTSEQADQVMNKLLEKRDSNPDSMIDTVRTYSSLIPKEQDEKLKVIGGIRETLQSQALKFLKPDQKKELDRIRDSFDLRPITAEELPESLVRHFREPDGRLGRIVYVFPDNSRQLWFVENVTQFSDEVRSVSYGNGQVANASSEAVIIADILEILHNDTPLIIFSALGAIVLLLLFKFRSITVSLKVLLPLLVAYLWMSGLLEVLDIRITFLNFIVLPMALGIGIDYSTNVFHRYELEGEGSIEEVLRTTGGAVLLCSATTAIGYAALLAAHNQALINFGRLGLMSEICTVTAALVLAPAVLVLLEKRRTASSVTNSPHS